MSLSELTEQEKLGVTLFHKRCKLCLRQVDVAKGLYMETQAISMYERGTVKTIPFETRIKLAQALDLSLEEILYDSEKDCLKLRRLKEYWLLLMVLQKERQHLRPLAKHLLH